MFLVKGLLGPSLVGMLIGLEDEDKKVVLVIPLDSLDKFVPSRNLSSLSRVKEMDLICAAFSGHLDPSTIVAAPVVISSSCSTDETVVADSDEEAETAISVDMSAAVITTECTKHEIKEESSIDHAATRLGSPTVTCSTDRGYTVMSRRDQVDNPESGNPYIKSSDRDNTITARRDHVDEPESGNPDIIYSQILIVRDTNVPISDYSSLDTGVPNFKCFKKVNCLYLDSDYGSEEVVESVKEEKKRKQMEAIAEDLFNNERGRKRGVAGSLHGILTRS
ncbi:nijmegen breakage syndrome 1 [Actinidia rufa]|uniref:Nijmegen breakage syndrome 1 n=1 Tax=Actinidia rufa TaxID=165716 RepID=A0A7J0GFI8_9ERIC|nr:nijmegen breakage syndrome 1 [Actinidia rufa]